MKPPAQKINSSISLPRLETSCMTSRTMNMLGVAARHELAGIYIKSSYMRKYTRNVLTARNDKL